MHFMDKEVLSDLYHINLRKVVLMIGKASDNMGAWIHSKRPSLVASHWQVHTHPTAMNYVMDDKKFTIYKRILSPIQT